MTLPVAGSMLGRLTNLSVCPHPRHACVLGVSFISLPQDVGGTLEVPGEQP